MHPTRKKIREWMFIFLRDLILEGNESSEPTIHFFKGMC